MRPTAFLALACLLLSARAWAGESYSFTLEQHEGIRNSTQTGHVLVDGDHGGRYRLELDPKRSPRYFDVLISQGAGAAETGLNLAGRTHYTLKQPDPSVPMNRVLWFFARTEGKSVSKVRTDNRDASGTESLAGLSVRRYETSVSYDLRVRYPAETLKGHVTIQEVAWMAEDRTLPLPSLLKVDVHTALPEVDAALGKARSRLRGFPVKTRVTIDIDMGGGSERQTYVYSVTVQDLKPAETPDSLFQVPDGFRYEEPVLMAPGMPSSGG